MPQGDAQPDHAKSVGRDALTVGSITFGSRLLGLMRDLVTARIFGDTAIGSAFAAAFIVPNTFRRLFGEGALSAAFLPEYTRMVDGVGRISEPTLRASLGPDVGSEIRPTQASAFAARTVALLALFTGVLCILIELGLLVLLLTLPPDSNRDLSLRLMMVAMPFMPLICVAAILGGMLQAHGRFAPWSAAPIVLNLCVLAVALPFFFIEWARPAVWAYPICAAAVVAGAIQVAWSLAELRKFNIWNKKEGNRQSAIDNGDETNARVRAMLARMLPALIGMGTLQINSLIDTFIAMWPNWVGPTVLGHPYPLDEASNSILFFSQRIYQFPLGVFGIAVATAIFPALSRSAPDATGFAAVLRRGIRLSMFIAIPASIGLVLVRRDLTSVLYSGGGGFSDDGITRAGSVLLGYALAVWAYSLNQLWTRAFYANNDTTTPMRVAIAMVALNVMLNIVLIWPLREAGLAWSTAICAVLQSLILGVLVKRKLMPTVKLLDAPTTRSIALSIVLTGVLIAPALLAARALRADTWGGHLLGLCAVTGIGVLIYGAGSLILKRPEPSWLLGREH